MSESPVMMPDGTPFEFWDDTTEYTRAYHIACEHPDASDDGPGTEECPFATIGRAAKVLQPGEKAVVHGGVYRECVRPTRGGDGPNRMIAYEAAPGEEVHIRGSRVWAPEFVPSEGWPLRGLPAGVTIWMADMPETWFVGYNPFQARNVSSEFIKYFGKCSEEVIYRFLLRRGMVFVDGQPLRQVLHVGELSDTDGAFWVEDPGLRIHLRLPGDGDPKGVTFEVTTQEQVFAPAEPRLGYVRVSGFHFEHGADGIPVPQRAMVSANRGHHWIVEGNRIRRANVCGLDVGNQTWYRGDAPEPSGYHIIRRNHISECGVCGIAGSRNNDYSLVEDNLIEYIGSLGVERISETAGLKFHHANKVLIRRNVFRHLHEAPGIWLDVLNINSRVTGNVLADIESSRRGGIYIEESQALNVVDHNIIWDLRGAQRGPGVYIDCGEKCVVAHNLFGKMHDWYAVGAHLRQKNRIVAGRVGLCRQHKVLNNVLIACPKRILFARSADNTSDGNLFDMRDDYASLCIEYPEPSAVLNFSGWQEFYGLDANSRQVHIHADFDSETLVLTLTVEGEIPDCAPVEELHEGREDPFPGPIKLAQGRQEYRIRAGIAPDPDAIQMG